MQPKVNKIESQSIKSSAYVTVTTMKHILEVQHMLKTNNTAHIRKIDSERYMLIETGEIKEFKKSDHRGQNENSLRKTFKKLRYLINNNFEGSKNELFFTATYKENMTDLKRLYNDVDKFMKRLRYKYREQTSVEYINVVEPQARGAWHCHMLLRFDDLDSVFIPNNDLAKMWGHGFTNTKRLEEVDNIGAYLTTYLTDFNLDDFSSLDFKEMVDMNNREIVVREIEGEEKSFVKGGRLPMYPSGMNIFRKSKGIVYPERNQMSYRNLQKKVGSAKPHYQKSYEVSAQDFYNVITYEQYNLKR